MRLFIAIRLDNNIKDALTEAGIPFDRKRFSPHITVLRKATVDRLPRIDVPAASMTADTVSLMRSERGKRGVIYTELGSAEAIGS